MYSGNQDLILLFNHSNIESGLSKFFHLVIHLESEKSVSILLKSRK